MPQPVPENRAQLLHELRSLTKDEVSSRLLSTKQVALLFGVGERTIRAWAEKGWVPTIHTRQGSHWKFLALDILQAYEESHHQIQASLPRHLRFKE